MKGNQSITSAVVYLGQGSRYDVFFAVNHMARSLSKPSKVHMGTAKHLLRFLSGSITFFITHKRGVFKLTAYSNTNWDKNPDYANSMSSYIVMLANDRISFEHTAGTYSFKS